MTVNQRLLEFIQGWYGWAQNEGATNKEDEAALTEIEALLADETPALRLANVVVAACEKCGATWSITHGETVRFDLTALTCRCGHTTPLQIAVEPSDGERCSNCGLMRQTHPNSACDLGFYPSEKS